MNNIKTTYKKFFFHGIIPEWNVRGLYFLDAEGPLRVSGHPPLRVILIMLSYVVIDNSVQQSPVTAQVIFE